MSPSMFTFLRFHLLYYYLQFINHTICSHALVNSRTSKPHITSCNKRKQLSTITLFIFILELLAHPIPFFGLLTIF
jgi:hypothetical protein